jgi:hypothetical protein
MKPKNISNYLTLCFQLCLSHYSAPPWCTAEGWRNESPSCKLNICWDAYTACMLLLSCMYHYPSLLTEFIPLLSPVIAPCHETCELSVPQPVSTATNYDPFVALAPNFFLKNSSIHSNLNCFCLST